MTETNRLKHGVKLVGRGSSLVELLEDLEEIFGPDANFREAMFGCYIYPKTRFMIEAGYGIRLS